MSNSSDQGTPSQAMPTYDGGGPGLNIAGAATTLVKTGHGVVRGVTVNTLVGGATIKLYDALTAVPGNIVATITLPGTITGACPFTLPYGLAFVTGLTVVTSGATDITVTYF